MERRANPLRNEKKMNSPHPRTVRIFFLFREARRVRAPGISNRRTIQMIFPIVSDRVIISYLIIIT
jgi:hypothetical protein